MCGIAGKYNFRDGSPVDQKLIKAMCAKMAYRGPDDEGVYVNGPIGLGHRRLSILDLSALGHQPMPTRDKSAWVTYNGEIYNFQFLKKNLEKEGFHFDSNCDTEVLLALYQKHGIGCLDLLRGMFAFGIWDERRKKLFLARDRIGKKPLFYYYDGKRLIFASEIKCILEDPLVTKEINYPAFYDYFKYLYVPDPKTIYKNIYKLPPGHYLECTSAGVEVKEYWDVSFSEPSLHSEREIAEELLHILEESVKLRQISDVPLGAFLSGGIDSSAVVALMAQNQSEPVTTCAIGFDSKKYDEIEYARIVANKFRTDHHEFTVKQKAEKVLKKLAFHFDEPFADNSSVPTYYVSKLAREKVTVALSGDGGDENFAGYEKYHIDDVENRLRSFFPRVIRENIFSGMSRLFSRGNNVFCRKSTSLLKTLSHDSAYGFYLTNTEMRSDLWDFLVLDEVKRKLDGYDPFEVTNFYYSKADTDDHLSKILYTDLKTYLSGDILVKVDRMSMAHSLEVRAPILDHKVIEYAASIPAALKYKNREKKYILKESFKGILPDEIMYRKKMGFSVPLSDWLRGELKNFAHGYLFNSKAGLYHFFSRPAVKQIWDIHQSQKNNYAVVLWSMLMFELWYQQFME